MRRWSWVIVLAAMLLCSSPSWADRLSVHEMVESPQYEEKVMGMLGRGLLNATTGCVDVATRIIEEPMETTYELWRPGGGLRPDSLPAKSAMVPGFLVGFARGVVYGIVCGGLRTASGAVDLVTFWVPGFRGAPVSDSYHDCLIYPTGL